MARYTIKLKEPEMKDFYKIINKGKHSIQAFRAAYILLNCDKEKYSKDKTITNTETCKILKIGDRTIDRVKKKFIEEGFKSVLQKHLSSQNYMKNGSSGE